MSGKLIQVLFDPSRENMARDVSTWLIETGRATLLKEEDGSIHLRSIINVIDDSVLVFVSDEATENPSWQKAVRGVDENARMIPIGIPENADFSNPDVIPTRIEEINFIKEDEYLRDNIYDSLVTDSDFYYKKNELLALEAAWWLSDRSDSYLLTNVFKARKDLRLMQEKILDESDPYFRNQLERIINFLNESYRFSRKIFVLAIWRKIRRVAYVVAAAVMIAAVFTVSPHLRRANYTSTVVAAGIRNDLPAIHAMRLVDGLENPMIPYRVKFLILGDLIEYVDMNWPQSPIGAYYAWALNDFSVTSNHEYVWTANGNGQIARWNRKTGQIAQQEDVSSSSLVSIDVTDSEDFFAVIDSEGFVFTSDRDLTWRRSETSLDLSLLRNTQIVISDKGDLIVAHDRTTAVIMSTESQLQIEDYFNFERILDVEILDDTILLAVVEDGQFKCIEIRTLVETKRFIIPTTVHDTCSAILQGGRMLFADANNQVNIWDRAQPESFESIGLTLPSPLFLAFVNDYILVYHDRNIGTRFYDFERKIDIGQCLPSLPAIVQLAARDGQVFVYDSSIILSEDVNNLLPRSNVGGNQMHTFQDQYDINNDGIIREISIKNNYMISLTYEFLDHNRTILIDGTNRYFVGDAQKDESLMDGFPSNYEHPLFQWTNFIGHPTVVGVLDSGKSVIIGAYDGNFFELSFLEGYGQFLVTSSRRIPSHSAVVAIHKSDDWYYLEDADGLFWRARLGYRTAISNEYLYLQIKEKIQTAFEDELFDLISSDVAEYFDLKRLPGSDGREWE